MTDAQERFLRACELSEEHWLAMGPAERDRMMQLHLAAARGAANNFLVACEMSDLVRDAHHARQDAESSR